MRGQMRMRGQFSHSYIICYPGALVLVLSHSYIICYPHTVARPLRLEFAGALYHLASRGDRREAIYRSDDDREAWLEILGNVCDQF